MADKKISELNNATTPLAGTELVPIVQSGETKKVAVSEFNISTPTLQQVTDAGNTTDNDIEVTDGLGRVFVIDKANSVYGLGDVDANNGETSIVINDSVNTIDIRGKLINSLLFNLGANTTTLSFSPSVDNEVFLPDEDGTIATREWVTSNAGGSNVITEINTTGTASSGTTETITYAQLIPANTLEVGVYDAIARVNKSAVNGTVTLNLYVNTVNNLTGSSVLIGKSISTATARYMPIQKFIDVKVLNGTGLGTEVANVSNNAQFPNDYIQHGNTAGMSNVAIDWTVNQYLILTVTNASASDSSTGTFLILKK